MTSTPAAPVAGAAPHKATGVAGPESLDQAIETTSPRGWWALIAIAVALALVTVWAFVATIPQQVTTPGVVSAFQYTYNISAPADGIVDFDQRLTGQVTAGQQVGTITPFAGGVPVPVTAPDTGQVKSVYVTVGSGVSAGTLLANVLTVPDPALGIDVFAYMPESAAARFFVGQEVTVSVEDVATSTITTTTGRVADVATSPSTLAGLTTQTGSDSLAEKWVQQSGGAPFRVIITMDQWPTGVDPPGPGELVTIVNTYASIHPIQMLFGGG